MTTTALVVPIVPPQSVPVLSGGAGGMKGDVRVGAFATTAASTVTPGGAGAAPGSSANPTTMLFNVTWWLFFHSLVAYLQALGTPEEDAFPLDIVQEAAQTVPQGSLAGTEYFYVVFPQALAQTGNTAFILLSINGGAVFTLPAGWTIAFDSAILAGGVLSIGPGTSRGSGYAIGDTGLIAGGDGTAAYRVLTVTAAIGEILTSSLGSAGGTGYAPGDTGLIVGGDGTAAYTVNTVDGSGAILTYTITVPGATYTAATNAATTVSSGGGDGALTLNVLTVSAAVGAVLTAAVNVPGAGYAVAANVATTVTSGTGDGTLTLDILDVGRDPRLLLLSRISGAASAGTILSSSLGSSIGTGYAPGDVGVIDGGTPFQAVYQVLTVNGSGGVLTYRIFDNGVYPSGGLGYAPASNVGTVTESGSGDGTLTFNILTVGDLTALFTLTTSTSDVGAAYFFEVAGDHALDQVSIAAVTESITFPDSPLFYRINLPSITPAANSAVFGIAATVPDFFSLQANCINPAWRAIGVPGSAPGFWRSLFGFVGVKGALGSPVMLPQLGVASFTGSGQSITAATFSIL